MVKDQYFKWIDLKRYRRMLQMKDAGSKPFFNLDGCGLEIEFGVRYERRCRSYIECGLRRIKEMVGQNGKFVPDESIGWDLNVEIVLMPIEINFLRVLFLDIKEIIDFYENFIFDANCGVHANFRADDSLKHAFYYILVNGGYTPERFTHSKYKMDFMDIVSRTSGYIMNYNDYIDYQKRISSKYAGVNFLKDNLIEFRTLDLDWNDIQYVFELYESAKEFRFKHADILQDVRQEEVLEPVV